MTTYRRSTRATLGLAAVALTAGLGTGTLGSDSAAAAASSMPGTGCNESSRLFQLRADGTELWYASTNQANADSPTVYSWKKIYDIPDGKGESIAAHSSNPDSKGVHLVLSDEHGALRTLNYNKAEGKITLDRKVAPGTATKPGSYRFTSLTSDGEKLYGINGGNLYVMTSIKTDAPPGGKAKISNAIGMWPQAFYGNPAGDFDIAWTDSAGKLTYGDVRSTSPGKWEITDRNVVQSSGYGSKAMTSPGGGILLRSSGTELIRYQSTETDVSGRKTIKTGWNVNNSNPITTVPDVCRTTAEDGPIDPSASNVENSFNFFVAKGYSKVQAAGIVGNLMAESGQNIDPTAKEAGYPWTGRGIAQWNTGGRWDTDQVNLLDYARERGESAWTLSPQLNFIVHEFDTHTWLEEAEFKRTTTISDATRVFQENFERCGDCHAGNRYEYAKEVYNKYA